MDPKVKNYLLYTSLGAAGGAVKGVVGSKLLYPKEPVDEFLAAGSTVIGGGMGALLAHLKNRRMQDSTINQLKPGWYMSQQLDAGPLNTAQQLLGGTTVQTAVLTKKDYEELQKDPFWEHVSAQPLTNDKGEADRYLLTLSEKELQRARKKMEKAGGLDREVLSFTNVPLEKDSPVELLESIKKRTVENNITDPVELLRAEEDKHKLKYYGDNLSGEYLRSRKKKRRDTLEDERRLLQKSYARAALHGAGIGSVLGGAIAGGSTALYGLTSNNSKFRGSEALKTNLMNAGVATGAGIALGAGIGAVSAPLHLALQKRKTRQELLDKNKTLFEKESAWQDYAIHGFGGTAIGVGTGILLNKLLRRRWNDYRLLLVGAGAGAATGTMIGAIRSRERDTFQKADALKETMYQRGADGKPLLAKNGEKLYRPGWYVSFRRLPIANVKGTDKRRGWIPFADNNAQHAAMIGISDKPVNVTYTKNGVTYQVQSQKLRNGQYALTYEMAAQYRKAGEPFNNPNPLHAIPAKTFINGVDVNSDTLRTPGSFKGTESADWMLDYLNDKESAGPAYRVYPLQTFSNSNKDQDRFLLGAQQLTNRHVRNEGDLGFWSILPSWMSGKHKNTCVSWVHYLTRGMINSGAMDEPDWSKYPKRFTGFAESNFRRENPKFDEIYGEFLEETP